MANSNQYVFIEGSFADLAQELADFLNIGPDVTPLLEQNKKDEVLKKLVTASVALNSIPEKEIQAAYNLLIYLVLQSPSVNMFLPRICENLSKPITSSPVNGHGIALSILGNVFNLLQPDNEVRFNVFQAILRLVKQSGSFEVLKPQIAQLDQWMAEWDIDEEDKCKMFTQLAEVAEDAGEEEQSYKFILKALRTFDPKEADEINSKEAQSLSLRALKAALLSATHFDFSDLTCLPTVQALSDSHPIYSELLEIFSEKELEDYNDFRDEHEGWIEEEDLDNSTLHRKMRYLTLASLAAANNNTRELDYKLISKALQIAPEDVEEWVINVIKAGLIEGKLSQQKKVFMVHRTTYRVFGDKQWREVATRLDSWKTSLRAVKEIISRERQAQEAQKERDMHEVERKAAGTSGMGAGRRPGRQDNMVEMGTD